MKFSLSWLSEFVEIKLPLKQLVEVLSAKSFETVLSVPPTGKFKNIFTAEVTKIEPHPHADRLRLVAAQVGSKTYAPIVCGAFNFGVGDKVVFAYPGASVYDQHGLQGKTMILAAAKIRGIESKGMILSAFELGVGDDRSGILVLPKGVKSGAPFAEYWQHQTRDQILEVDLGHSNRSDVLSHRGLSAEIAAVVAGSRFKAPPLKVSIPIKQAGKRFSITVKSPDLCSRYIGVLLSGVQVGSSPPFLARRLQGLGIKPINNVVDITNYVMLELGNPLHAFDAQKLDGKKIVVRRARRGEQLETLDQETRKLSDSMLVIADESKPVALAGIMGGSSTAVTAKTETVLLEGAAFDGISVRATCRNLGLQTESASRFVKNLPPVLSAFAVSRAVELLKKYAGAKVVEAAQAGTYKKKPSPIPLSLGYARELLGIPVSPHQAKRALSALGFTVRKKKKGHFAVLPPSLRSDIQLPEDIIEEIGRVVGYENIPARPVAFAPTFSADQPELFWKDRLRQFFASAGFFETYNYSFVSEQDLRLLGVPQREAVTIANPQSEAQAFLRGSLLAGLLKTLTKNLKYFSEVKLFEFGRVFKTAPSSAPEEPLMFGGVVSAKNQGVSHLFRLCRGVLEELNRRFCNSPFNFVPAPSANQSVFTRSVVWGIGGLTIGELGVVEERVLGPYGIKLPVVYFSMNLGKILPYLVAEKPFGEVSRFPGIVYDISMILDRKYMWAEIVSTVKKAGGSELSAVELFDEYLGPKIPAGKRSLAFHLVFQSGSRTLREEEVRAVYDKIVKALQGQFGAEIRK